MLKRQHLHLLNSLDNIHCFLSSKEKGRHKSIVGKPHYYIHVCTTMSATTPPYSHYPHHPHHPHPPPTPPTPPTLRFTLSLLTFQLSRAAFFLICSHTVVWMSVVLAVPPEILRQTDRQTDRQRNERTAAVLWVLDWTDTRLCV